jgi:carboxymethylenebutenolidase
VESGATVRSYASGNRKFERADDRCRIEVYEGARHGYTMVDSPVCDEEAAERHLRELRGLLERTLG